jgi:prevent-host-death family protein
MAVEKVSSREARSNWRDLLDKIMTRTTDIVIERNGQLIAALIPIEDYEALKEELEHLRASRRAGMAYLEWQGDPTFARPLEHVEADLIAKGLLDE